MGDRYTILGSIAKGGMAEVYLGRMVASAGFTRPVAIKRLHDALGTDPEFVAMLVDEARLTARIRHTNVVDILDVVVQGSAFALVLEWVEGASLSMLSKRAMKAHEPVPEGIVNAVMVGVLRGLAAAHEARDEDGQPLGIVHRDVSPQNVLVGVDGIPRIIDFGVAKAVGKLEATRPGEIRGKYAYMAPEQLLGRPITNQVDVYAAGVMMWELYTARRLFKHEDERATIAAVLQGDVPPPSVIVRGLSPEIDAIVAKAVAREPYARYLDAREMLASVEKLPRASDEEVGAWVREGAADVIARHQRLLQAAPAPVSARSIDAVLAELEPSRPPSQRSLPEIDDSASFRLPPPSFTPAPAPLPTQAPPAKPSRAIALVVGAAIATLALGLGVRSLATAGTRTPEAAPWPPAAPLPLVTTSAEPTAAATATATAPATASATAVATATAEPSAAPSAPSPRTRAKVIRPRTAPSQQQDPTDHR